ncbi:phenol 2-monooxygenase [Alloyangia pacifica]|uniref:Phenol 2-monooxygenase n=1 Tax=Alloyangia pacifica TaxID=311180 RepID=A0A2U8HA04_9RHOB|nr:FAD-dependent monooxygenase [Alloyangia pacifica]AWI82732.1 phenol 2-monooxygenase [Alloyangia pacifica]
MQFHLNGFRSGDPAVAPALPGADHKAQDVDVLIVGCGPAGLTLAAQLSAFPEITVRIAERKPGPLEVGQADGIACRSLEMFEAFGFAEKVMKEGYWVNEVAFWRPDTDGVLHRADRIQDVADDLSEMPHVILNQARVHDFYLEIMRNSPRRLTPDYNRELVALSKSDDADHPMQATFNRRDGKGTETIRARYVVGCDGARSTVRGAMGHALKGESARQLWGVMDVLPVTDFPDIRLKAAIQSEGQGSVLIIPREGGYMVRLYIELGELRGDERAADRDVSAELLIAKAQAILAPYTLEVKEVAWWSAYEIGQRVCDAFDDVPEDARGTRSPRVFIAGDACHTHSPKAGQGMNVSMADTFNLGWKLAAVLRGRAAPALLDTYSEERRAKAKELIDFDRDMARLFSAKPKDDAEAEQFQRYFTQHGRYTAGVETRYDASLITGGTEHQALAAGQVVGKRFHSAPVVRLADAKPMQLGHAFKADGRWRVLAFAPEGDSGQPGGAIAQFCDVLVPVIARFTPKGADPDSVIDLRAVFQTPHREMRLEALPPALLPKKGRHGLTDFGKAFCPAFNGPDIFDLRGIDRSRGALLVLRPDQYVAQVLPLDAEDEISIFFNGFLLPA